MKDIDSLSLNQESAIAEQDELDLQQMQEEKGAQGEKTIKEPTESGSTGP